MKTISLLVTIVLLLTLTTSFNTLASPLHKPRSKHETKYVKASAIKSDLDALKYLDQYGYNLCENRNGSSASGENGVLCQSSVELMLKEFQAAYRLPATGKLDSETLKLMNTARCALSDKPFKSDEPFFYRASQAW